MKVKGWVEFSEEVEVEISRADVIAAFSERPEDSWLMVLNRVAFALNALPDTTIATLTAAQRQATHRFLARHAARFADTALPPAHGEVSP
jgi:hypothetical protein